MKLALEFGMTERELLGRLDSVEYGKWRAYFSIFPFKEERADIRAAMIASESANDSYQARGGKNRPFKIQKWIIDYLKKPQTLEQMKNLIRMFAKTHNSALEAKK